MDTAVEEKVTNMEPGDCALTKSEIALEASEENIYEPGPSNSGTPEPDLVISDSEVAKNSVNEKSKCNTVDDRNDCIYHIKWISRNGIKTPIITQVIQIYYIFFSVVNLIFTYRIKCNMFVAFKYSY